MNEYFIYLLISCCLSWTQVTITGEDGVLLNRTGCWRLMTRATALMLNEREGNACRKS